VKQCHLLYIKFIVHSRVYSTVPVNFQSSDYRYPDCCNLQDLSRPLLVDSAEASSVHNHYNYLLLTLKSMITIIWSALSLSIFGGAKQLRGISW